jgi:hypothetical protein
VSTNFFFNNFGNSQEQLLIEDLITESIKIYGLDMFYIPRTTVSQDNIFNEDPNRRYDTAIPIEMYVKNVDGFGGEGDFLSKFNIQIRDQITFTISRRIFDQELGINQGLIRAREGDLIYLPLNRKLFEIKFVEHEAIFYQLGSLQTYDLKCELFEYSNEKFTTGIADIDIIETRFAQKQDLDVVSIVGRFLIGETIQQTVPDTDIILTAEVLVQATNISFPDQATLQVIRFNNGAYDQYTTFVNNAAIVGLTSTTTAVIREGAENQTDGGDNDFFQTEGDSFIDFTTRDPFSEGGTY